MSITRFILFPFVLCFSVALYFSGRRCGDLSTIIATEWRAICARFEIRIVLAREGMDAARLLVYKKYRTRLELLTEDGELIAARLAEHPADLAEWLSRLPEPPGG